MKRSSPPSKSKETGQFRIIAGLHRGRKLEFPAVANLRPTPDRVRETLFNWLLDACQQGRCLDLFAGAGSLGLEALSRGALDCTFIEHNKNAAQAITDNSMRLQLSQVKVLASTLPQAIEHLNGKYNVVFIDPPYALDIINDCVQQLIEHQLLDDKAWLYIENDSHSPAIILPKAFSLHREKIFGQVRSALFQFQQIS